MTLRLKSEDGLVKVEVTDWANGPNSELFAPDEARDIAQQIEEIADDLESDSVRDSEDNSTEGRHE